jgi:entericidin B
MTVTSQFLLKTFLLFTCILTLSACETMNGAGRDIENAGDAVQDAAQ